MLRSKESIKRDNEFFSQNQETQMKMLNITEDTFKMPRFRGLPKETVISDLWNGKTNSQRRAIIK